MQKGFITQKIVMMPDLGFQLASGPFSAATGAGEGFVVHEIDGDVKPVLVLGKRDGGYLPGWRKTKSCGKN